MRRTLQAHMRTIVHGVRYSQPTTEGGDMLEERMRARIQELQLTERTLVDELHLVEERRVAVSKTITELVGLLDGTSNDEWTASSASEHDDTRSTDSDDDVSTMSNAGFKELVLGVIRGSAKPVSPGDVAVQIFGTDCETSELERHRNRTRTAIRRMADRGEVVVSDYVDPHSPTKRYFEPVQGGPTR
jgi:hypothetical protein